MSEVTNEVVNEVKTETPSLEEVLAGVRFFGIEDYEEILTLDAGGRKVQLRISNIPTEEEVAALLSQEQSKGYIWVQLIKCEMLSRAISWIDGVNIRELKGTARFVPDPTDATKAKKDVQVVLRNLILGWGQEVTTILWKAVMVHSQRIEDRLAKSFPDSAVMTEVEKRFMDQALREIEAANKNVIAETINELTVEDKPKEE
jgi:hypothetical protein